MKRKSDIYLKDILISIERIEDYVKDMDIAEFSEDQMVVDAVMRNLEIIGEAASQIPEEFRKKHDKIQWQKIKDFRNVISHKYWEVDFEIVGDILENKISELKKEINDLISELEKQEKKNKK